MMQVPLAANSAARLPPIIERPIFILGPGRSGTTLLRSMLSAHPHLAVTPETHFLARAKRWGLEHEEPADFEAFWNDYTSWVRFHDLGVDADRCRELMRGERSFKAIFSSVLSAYGEKTGKRRVGEKTPGHSRFLPCLLDWFPDARILVTQRDPRAVVASQLQTAYVRKRLTPFSVRNGLLVGKRLQEIAFFADNWADVFERRLAPWRGDPRFHTVVYEALVRQPEAEARAICDFLGEPFTPDMLEQRTEAAAPMPAGRVRDAGLEQWRMEHHARSLGRISTDSLHKWQHELSGAEVAMIEGRCSHAMRAAGYALSLGPIRRTVGRAARTAVSYAAAAESAFRRIARDPARPIRAVRGRVGSP